MTFPTLSTIDATARASAAAAQATANTALSDAGDAQADATQALADAATAQSTADAAFPTASFPTWGSDWGTRTVLAPVQQTHPLAAVADLLAAPGSGTWLNEGGGVMASAAIASNVLTGTTDTSTSVNLDTSSNTSPRYYWDIDAGDFELAARLYSNSGAFSASGVGVLLFAYPVSDVTKVQTVRVLEASGGNVSDSNGVQGSGTGSSALADPNAGIWMRIRCQGGRLYCERNTAAGATYPATGWSELVESAVPTGFLDGGTMRVGIAWVRTGATGACVAGVRALRFTGVPQ